jgi:probable rRNA maturation factor
VLVRAPVRGRLDPRTIRRRLQRLLEALGHADDTVCVVLTDDEELRALNHQWRSKDKATDVLSFPAAAPGFVQAPGQSRELGDVLVSLETAARQAEEGALPRLAMAVGEARLADWTLLDEVSFVLLHGVLHLLGHDHIKAAERRTMEALEHAHLGAMLGRPVPNARSLASRNGSPRS